MRKIAFDSSIIIEEDRRGSELYGELLEKVKSGELELVLSVVVIMELWAGDSMRKENIRKGMESRIKPFEILNLDILVAKKAGEIRRSTGLMGVDAMIAAICIVNDCELVTLNTKHFKNIKGLKLYK
jgi:predicted nucleic acid-binding protein